MKFKNQISKKFNFLGIYNERIKITFGKFKLEIKI